MKRSLLSIGLLAAMSSPAWALSDTYLAQWRGSVDVQMIDLVSNGYQLKAVLDLSKPREYGAFHYFLQKDASLMRCIDYVWAETGRVLLSCSELTAPYVERPTR